MSKKAKVTVDPPKSVPEPIRLASFFQNLYSKVRGIPSRVEELTPEDVVVAVMGPTGSGKSSFIELATGITGTTGDTLASNTSQISVVKLPFPGLNLCFVDTPGFDDTTKSDHEIFKMISEWLLSTYKNQIHLAALLYFHRISDNRIGGTCLSNQIFFEKLCGKDFKSIFLTTTMWDLEDEHVGAEREEELKRNFWRPMIQQGSTVKRFLHTRESAFEILVPIFDTVHKKSTLFLHKDIGLQLAMSPLLRKEVVELLSRQQSILARIRGDAKGLVDFDQVKLIAEYQDLSVKLQHAVGEIQKLKGIDNQDAQVPGNKSQRMNKIQRTIKGVLTAGPWSRTTRPTDRTMEATTADPSPTGVASRIPEAGDGDNKADRDREDDTGGSVTNKQLDDHVRGNGRWRPKGVMDHEQESDRDKSDLGKGDREDAIVEEQRKKFVDESTAKKRGEKAKAVALPDTPVLDNWVRTYLPWVEPNESDNVK